MNVIIASLAGTILLSLMFTLTAPALCLIFVGFLLLPAWREL